MNARMIVTTVCGVISAFAIAAFGAPPNYLVTDLGEVVGGEESRAHAINRSGQVVGSSFFNGIGYTAFLWDANGLLTLGPGEAFAINNLGVVAGRSFIQHPLGGRDHAVLWRNGSMVDLGPCSTDPYGHGLPQGDSWGAWGINDREWLACVGSTEWAGSRALLHKDGVITDLGAFGSNSACQAIDVNGMGLVAGFGGGRAFLLSPQDTNGDGVPDVWRRDDNHDGINDLIVDLGSLDSSQTGLASTNAINESGQIVGGAYVDAGRNHAFLWTPDGTDGIPGNPQMRDLGVLQGTIASYALALNDVGQVVGQNGVPYHAFLWESGAIYDLNDFIPLGSGWELREATGINDAGQIVGSGYFNGVNKERAFLLTPIPEPATLSVLVPAGALLLRSRRNPKVKARAESSALHVRDQRMS